MIVSLIFIITISDAKSLLPSLLFDMVNQISLKPFEESSMSKFPINAVTREGFENPAMADRFVLPPKTTVLPGTTKNRITNAGSANNQYYRDHCQFCHGSNAKTDSLGFAKTKMNEVGMTAPALPTLTPYFTDLYLDQKIAKGGVIMPSQGHALNAEERAEIVRYLRSLEK